jgi:hypothetical protein
MGTVESWFRSCRAGLLLYLDLLRDVLILWTGTIGRFWAVSTLIFTPSTYAKQNMLSRSINHITAFLKVKPFLLPDFVWHRHKISGNIFPLAFKREKSFRFAAALSTHEKTSVL